MKGLQEQWLHNGLFKFGYKFISLNEMSVSENENINVLSLFDGMSCGQIALNRAGIEYENYFSSEIDKYSIIVTQHNYPNTIQLGDVKKINTQILPNIFLLMGGSPCQSFSIGNTTSRDGFNSDNGKLFYDYVRILNEIKPRYFIYENVRMKKSDLNFVSTQLGVKPNLINSSLFSAQNRERYYWTNIKFELPQKPSNTILKDIVDFDVVDNKFNHLFKSYPNKNKNIYKPNRIGYIDNLNRGNRVYSVEGKSVTLTKSGGGKGRNTGLYEINGSIRRLTINECEKLQTVPVNYCNVDGVSDNQKYAMLGNGWTVDVIVHILKYIKNE